MVKTSQKSIQCWAFIDTNIFLDFYRSNNEARIPLLQKIQQVEARIISTYQVQMEFLKHRQEVLLKSLLEMKSAVTSSPAVVDDGHILTATRKIREHTEKRTKYLKSRVTQMLSQPNTHDQVYQAFEHLFKNPNEHVLKRSMDIRMKIKRRAWRRFILGYPPRKQGDTSIGDALNWEWIVECASQLQGRFHIVSRDADYGCEYGGAYYLNDQLKAEFRDRVGGKSIVYTRRLTDALKALEVHVTQQEVDAETEVMANPPFKPEGDRFVDDDRLASLHAILTELRPPNKET
jgi:predicted nucleic acid-binding protein